MKQALRSNFVSIVRGAYQTTNFTVVEQPTVCGDVRRAPLAWMSFYQVVHGDAHVLSLVPFT